MKLDPARAEGAAQLILMLGVGSVAAGASWAHVVDLAERNGQPGWLAVADAAVLETLAVSMGLDVRRRRRRGESSRFSLCVLVAAVTLQLAAQVAQAPPTFWGWTMAALPAVGFLLLVKVAMTRTTVIAQPDARGEPQPAASLAPQAEEVPGPRAADTTAPARNDVPAAGSPTDASGSGGGGAEIDLLDAGREAAADLARRDVGLTRASLAAELRSRGVRVGTGRAGELLATLRAEQDRAAERVATHGAPAQDHHDRHLSSIGTRL